MYRSDFVETTHRPRLRNCGLKAVRESVTQPLAYYDNNVVGALRVLESMKECGVNTLVFSSSATVYGDPIKLPLTEDHPQELTLHRLSI